VEPGFAVGGVALDEDVPHATRIPPPAVPATETAAAAISVADEAERLPHEPASADLPDSDI